MRRIPQLDGLRGIAVLLVFLYHAWKVPLFWSGVDLFFVLSGYLITGILLRLKEKRATEPYGLSFYLRRVRRIIPPYAGFMLFAVLFIPAPWRHLWYWYTFFAANFAVSFGHVDVHALVPLWSLAVEEQFYFLWPWVVLACSLRGLRRVALGIVLCAPLLRALCTPLFPTRDFIYTLTPFRADLLAAGALVAVLSYQDAQWTERNRRKAFAALMASLALLVGLSTLHGFRQTANTVFFNTLGYSLIVIFFTSSLILTLTLRPGWAHLILTSPPLRYMGVISYTFYLYQVPLLDMIGTRVHSHLLSVGLAFAATAIVASLSWYLYESPILNWGNPHRQLHPGPA